MAISGGTTAVTKYYTANGRKVAMNIGNALHYLISDLLGSVSVTLKSDGSLEASQLFLPYGSVRYRQGAIPTAYNFTGQRLDEVTGLLYYNFRYYDPISGRFVRADTKETNALGLDAYMYVHGNPLTMIDPTGHWSWWATAAVGVGIASVAILLAPVAVPSLVVTIAGGVLAAFVTSAVVGFTDGSFTGGDSKLDDWGFRTLISEGIGGALNAAGWVGGRLLQGFAEGANISTWNGISKTILSPAQSAQANNVGQQWGYALASAIAAGINVSNLHAPGNNPTPKPVPTPTSQNSSKAPPPPKVVTRWSAAPLPSNYSHVYTSSWYNVVESAWRRSQSTVSSWQYHAQANWNYIKQLNMARQQAALGW